MHMITFLFSAPVSRYISSFVVSYIHIAPALTPVCVEMTSYIIVRPVNVIIVQPMIGYMLSQMKTMTFSSSLLSHLCLLIQNRQFILVIIVMIRVIKACNFNKTINR